MVIHFISLVFVFISSVYNFSIPLIEGGSKPLSEYQGKRIMVITLPINQNPSSDSLLHFIDSLGANQLDSLLIIGVPSYEDGFLSSQQVELKNWYRSKLGSYVLITNGLYTRKSSGVQQHPLFKWLTDVQLNEVINVDVGGPGYKFFINSSGKYYALLGPNTRITSNTLNKVLMIQ